MLQYLLMAAGAWFFLSNYWILAVLAVFAYFFKLKNPDKKEIAKDDVKGGIAAIYPFVQSVIAIVGDYMK